MKAEIPIACGLTNSELQQRRKTVLHQVAQYLIGVEELKNGFSYRFPAEDSVLQELAKVISLERKCCPFLNFNLTVEAQSEFVSLELTGKEGTKEILKSLFDWN